jgi:putative DNA-invertase from lambdoid prophage Rac
MTVYLYSRVSTLIQAEEGESLGVQDRMLRGYYMIHGLDPSDRSFVERGVSGSVPVAERPEGKRFLGTVARGDIIVCAKLDRMFRDARDALNVLHALRDRGVSLHFVDLGVDVCGNGLAKLMFTILSAFAEMERDRIRERVSEVKADQRKRNRYLGGAVPFGFKVQHGTLVEDTHQQAAIKEMRKL